MTGHRQDLQGALATAEAELRRLEERRSELLAMIATLREEQQKAGRLGLAEPHGSYSTAAVTHYSDEEKRIRLFRSLFRGREDVYPKRFESARTGESGYQPDCANECGSSSLRRYARRSPGGRSQDRYPVRD